MMALITEYCETGSSAVDDLCSTKECTKDCKDVDDLSVGLISAVNGAIRVASGEGNYLISGDNVEAQAYIGGNITTGNICGESSINFSAVDCDILTCADKTVTSVGTIDPPATKHFYTKENRGLPVIETNEDGVICGGMIVKSVKNSLNHASVESSFDYRSHGLSEKANSRHAEDDLKKEDPSSPIIEFQPAMNCTVSAQTVITPRALTESIKIETNGQNSFVDGNLKSELPAISDDVRSATQLEIQCSESINSLSKTDSSVCLYLSNSIQLAPPLLKMKAETDRGFIDGEKANNFESEVLTTISSLPSPGSVNTGRPVRKRRMTFGKSFNKSLDDDRHNFASNCKTNEVAQDEVLCTSGNCLFGDLLFTYNLRQSFSVPKDQQLDAHPFSLYGMGEFRSGFWGRAMSGVKKGKETLPTEQQLTSIVKWLGFNFLSKRDGSFAGGHTAAFENQFYGIRNITMRTCPYVGLENLGATCYLNVYIQLLFMNVHFREKLMNLPTINQLAHMEATRNQIPKNQDADYRQEKCNDELIIDSWCDAVDHTAHWANAGTIEKISGSVYEAVRVKGMAVKAENRDHMSHAYTDAPKSAKYIENDITNILSSKKYSLVSALQHIFAMLQESIQSFVKPEGIATLLADDFSFQEDANEMQHRLFDMLERDLGGSNSQFNFLPTLFRGTCTQKVTCKVCGYSGKMEEPFYQLSCSYNTKQQRDIQQRSTTTNFSSHSASDSIASGQDHRSSFNKLHMKTNGERKSVWRLEDEMASQFLKIETLRGDCKYLCPKCKKKQEGRKRVQLSTLPPYLQVVVLRYCIEVKKQTGEVVRRKIHEALEVPLDLNLKQCCTEDCKATDIDGENRLLDELPSTASSYRLFAVLEHQGASAASGHYTAIIRDLRHRCNNENHDSNAGESIALANESEIKEIDTDCISKPCDTTINDNKLIKDEHSVGEECIVGFCSQLTMEPQIENFRCPGVCKRRCGFRYDKNSRKSRGFCGQPPPISYRGTKRSRGNSYKMVDPTTDGDVLSLRDVVRSQKKLTESKGICYGFSALNKAGEPYFSNGDDFGEVGSCIEWVDPKVDATIGLENVAREGRGSHCGRSSNDLVGSRKIGRRRLMGNGARTHMTCEFGSAKDRKYTQRAIEFVSNMLDDDEDLAFEFDSLSSRLNPTEEVTESWVGGLRDHVLSERWEWVRFDDCHVSSHSFSKQDIVKEDTKFTNLGNASEGEELTSSLTLSGNTNHIASKTVYMVMYVRSDISSAARDHPLPLEYQEAVMEENQRIMLLQEGRKRRNHLLMGLVQQRQAFLYHLLKQELPSTLSLLEEWRLQQELLEKQYTEKLKHFLQAPNNVAVTNAAEFLMLAPLLQQFSFVPTSWWQAFVRGIDYPSYSVALPSDLHLKRDRKNSNSICVFSQQHTSREENLFLNSEPATRAPPGKSIKRAKIETTVDAPMNNECAQAHHVTNDEQETNAEGEKFPLYNVSSVRKLEKRSSVALTNSVCPSVLTQTGVVDYTGILCSHYIERLAERERGQGDMGSQEEKYWAPQPLYVGGPHRNITRLLDYPSSVKTKNAKNCLARKLLEINGCASPYGIDPLGVWTGEVKAIPTAILAGIFSNLGLKASIPDPSLNVSMCWRCSGALSNLVDVFSSQHANVKQFIDALAIQTSSSLPQNSHCHVNTHLVGCDAQKLPTTGDSASLNGVVKLECSFQHANEQRSIALKDKRITARKECLRNGLKADVESPNGWGLENRRVERETRRCTSVSSGATETNTIDTSTASVRPSQDLSNHTAIAHADQPHLCRNLELLKSTLGEMVYVSRKAVQYLFLQHSYFLSSCDLPTYGVSPISLTSLLPSGSPLQQPRVIRGLRNRVKKGGSDYCTWLAFDDIRREILVQRNEDVSLPSKGFKRASAACRKTRSGSLHPDEADGLNISEEQRENIWLSSVGVKSALSGVRRGDGIVRDLKGISEVSLNSEIESGFVDLAADILCVHGNLLPQNLQKGKVSSRVLLPLSPLVEYLIIEKQKASLFHELGIRRPLSITCSCLIGQFTSDCQKCENDQVELIKQRQILRNRMREEEKTLSALVGSRWLPRKEIPYGICKNHPPLPRAGTYLFVNTLWRRQWQNFLNSTDVHGVSQLLPPPLVNSSLKCSCSTPGLIVDPSDCLLSPEYLTHPLECETEACVLVHESDWSLFYSFGHTTFRNDANKDFVVSVCHVEQSALPPSMRLPVTSPTTPLVPVFSFPFLKPCDQCVKIRRCMPGGLFDFKPVDLPIHPADACTAAHSLVHQQQIKKQQNSKHRCCSKSRFGSTRPILRNMTAELSGSMEVDAAVALILNVIDETDGSKELKLSLHLPPSAVYRILDNVPDLTEVEMNAKLEGQLLNKISHFFRPTEISLSENVGKGLLLRDMKVVIESKCCIHYTLN